ncbi:DUF5072 family protein [Listeria welshimeri]|nr:DUF5072 family protein [Listeria welshimeri]
MLRRLSFTYVLKAVQKNLNRANLNCFVLSQENLQTPYVTIEMKKQDEVENEKLWEESYRFFIHVLATNLDELYLVIQKIEDELAVKVSVPEGYEIISQAAKGEQLMKQENNVVHAKMGYEFIISHGAKTKI